MEALHPLEHPLGFAAALFFVYYVLSQIRERVIWKHRTRGLPLPPGPRPLPLIGNLLDMPSFKQWVGFKDLCSKYGDLVYLDLLGRPMLIVGSARAATEILEKGSANTSDRPPSHSLPLTSNDLVFTIMRYGQWWRDHRRAFWQVFHPGKVGEYHNVERGFTHELLVKLLESPQDLEQHLRFALSATNMKVLYGLDAHQDENRAFIARVQDALLCTSELATQTHLVDYVPFLRHVPGWVPGAGFQYTFARCKDAVLHDKGQSQPCALAALLARSQVTEGPDIVDDAYQEDVIKNVGLAAFEAGSDTMLSFLLGLFFAMSQHPEVQEKVHAELDRMVGSGRLPDFGDREGLVYMNAVLKEALRWHVVVPLSLPHRTVEDDVYDGYFVPAGTIVIPNTWSMLQDPEVYERPEEFRPERFIRDGKIDTTSVRDPSTFAFGYGRRVCPGRYFADDLLYITAASVLHGFRFEPPLDQQGLPIKIKLQESHGLLSYPEDRRSVIKPRSEDASKLVVNVQDTVAYSDGMA